MRLGIYNLTFSVVFGRAYRTFERDWVEFHKYGCFLGHRLEWPIVPDLFLEHLSAFGQNFISMAISLGIVWNGLLSQNVLCSRVLKSELSWTC